jgi:hypothetical protein
VGKTYRASDCDSEKLNEKEAKQQAKQRKRAVKEQRDKRKHKYEQSDNED